MTGRKVRIGYEMTFDERQIGCQITDNLFTGQTAGISFL